MVSAVSHNVVPHHIQEQGGRVSSFFGRIFHLNWDKAHLLANLVLVVSGIAYAFFMKLPPMIMFSLGIYGCLVAILYTKAQKSRPSQSQIDTLEERLSAAKEKNTILEEKFKAEMSAQGISTTLQQDVLTNAAKLEVQAGTKARYEREIAALRTEKRSLGKTVAKLNRVMDAFTEECRRTERGSVKFQALREVRDRMNRAG